MPRKYYNEQAGLEFISQLAVPEELAGLRLAVGKKFYAVSAAAAVLRHVEGHYARFAQGTLRVRYQGSEGEIPPLLCCRFGLILVAYRLDAD